MKEGNLNIKKEILNKKDTCVVAVSTGIDSMCLFSYLFKNNYKIVVAHVNHKKRVESDKEYEYLKSYCESNNIPFEGYTLTKHIKSNFQEEARKERYAFFKRVADKYNTNKIVLAHHLNDEAETILMRLLRGSSIKGYKGMSLVDTENGYTYLRPLLYTTKEEISEYVNKENIKYFDDSSNSSDDYTRNYIRHNIIPLLEAVNPLYLSSIINYSKDMESVFRLVEKESSSFIDSFVELKDDKYVVGREKFNNLEYILKSRVLTKVYDKLTENSGILTHERIDNIIKLSLNSKESKTLELKKDYIVTIEYNSLIFLKKKETNKVYLEVRDFGEYLLDNNFSVIFSQKYHTLPSKNSYCLCYNEASQVFPIIIRNKEKGDKIVINSITKSVSKVLKDLKVSKIERDSVLVVKNKDGIFFIPNILRKETDTSLENKLYITFKRNEKWY